MSEIETGLENFIERHRADFDAFEPRPDLWDDIEQKLAAPATGSAASAPDEWVAESVRVVQLYPPAGETPAPQVAFTPAGRISWLPRPGMAAAVALLILAGFGAVWTNQHRSAGWANTGSEPLVLAAAVAEPADASAGLYFGASPVANATEAPAQQLITAVRRMETYYATQIRERKEELHQLEVETNATSAPGADWRHELTSLDSTYQQLKAELYRNPEPDVVLEAMNRNLQIRLDILNQQTRFREQVQEYHTPPLLIADSRPTP